MAGHLRQGLPRGPQAACLRPLCPVLMWKLPGSCWPAGPASACGRWLHTPALSPQPATLTQWLISSIIASHHFDQAVRALRERDGSSRQLPVYADQVGLWGESCCSARLAAVCTHQPVAGEAVLDFRVSTLLQWALPNTCLPPAHSALICSREWQLESFAVHPLVVVLWSCCRWAAV